MCVCVCVCVSLSLSLREREREYLDSCLQKGFMPATPGCIEHHCKRARILKEARSRHRSIAVAWLDLANEYGSVDHSLTLSPV